MKKIFKFLSISLCAIIAAAAIAVCALLFSTSLQTKIVNSVMPELKVGAASLSFSRIAIENLRYGNTADVKSLEMEYSALDALFGEINVNSLKIAGAKISLPKDGENAAAKIPSSSAAPAPLKSAKKGETPKTAGKAEKKFEFLYSVNVGAIEADVSVDGKEFKAVAKNIRMEKNLKPQNGFIQIETSGALLKATVETLNDSREIKAVLTSGDKKVVQISAAAPLDYSSLKSESRIDATDSLAAAFVPTSIKLPKFSLAVYAKADVSNSFKDVSLRVVGDSKVSGLAKVSEALKFLGEVGADVKIDATKTGGKISVQKLELNMSEGGSPILSVSAAPFSASSQAEMEKAELSATVSIPSRIINSLVPQTEISGDNITGKFSAKKRDGKYEVATTSPLSLTRIYIKKNGEPLLENLNLFIKAAAKIGDKIEADINAEVADSKTSRLALDVRISADDGKISADFKADGGLNPIITRVHSISAMSSLNLNISAGGAVRYANDKLFLDSFSTSIGDADKKTVAKIDAASKISYDIKSKKLESSSPKLAIIDASAFPFALVKPFVPEMDADTAAVKLDISSPKNDCYEVVGDIAVKAVSYKKDGAYLIRNISLSANAKAAYDGKTAKAEISKCLIGEGGNNFCTLDASAVYDTAAKKLASAKSDITATLPQIFNQPALLKFSNISRGTADIAAKYENGSLAANVVVHALSTRTSSNLIDKLAAEISSNFKKTQLALEIKTTSGETKASAVLDTEKNIDLNLKAASIVVDDVLVLAGAFSNPNYAENVPPPSPEEGKSQRIIKPSLAVVEDSKKEKTDSFAKKDAKAFWYFGKDVSITAKIDKVTSKGVLMLDSFNTAATASKNDLKLSKFSGKALDAVFSGASSLTFDAKREIPYTLESTKFKLTGLDVAKIFANKSTPPVTGIFNADFNVSGKGNNIQHLLQYAVGGVNISSTGGGVIRILDKNSTAGAGASMAGNILKITGKLLKNKVKELEGIGDLVTLMSRMDYTTAEMKLSRNAPDYNYNIDLVQMKTDSLIFLSKSGKIVFDPTVSFDEQKLDIPITIYMAGSSRTLFQKVGFGEKQSEVNGYYTGPTFKIFGTVSKPENDLMNVLTSTQNAVGNALESLNIFKRK